LLPVFAGVLVPIVVLSPHWRSHSAGGSFLDGIINVSAVREIVAAALPTFTPSPSSPSPPSAPEVLVFAAAHALSDHPALAVSVAASQRFAKRHRRRSHRRHSGGGIAGVPLAFSASFSV